MTTNENDPMGQIIRRLIAIDAALAGEGITAREASERFGISQKTFRRHINTLRSLGCAIPAGGKQAFAHVFRYTNRSRVFAGWLDTIHREG